MFCCYGCCIAYQVRHGVSEEHEAAWLLVRLGVGAFLAMNIMLGSLLLYSGSLDPADGGLRQAVHLLLGLLAPPVLVILGDPFLDRKSTRLNSSHYCASRIPSSAL